MSDDKARDIIERGHRAHALLNDELLKGAFDKMEADIIQAWKTWKADDPQGRERLWMALNQLGRVKDMLSTYVTNGRLEQRRINELVQPPTNLRVA